jgi:hypothetical protein
MGKQAIWRLTPLREMLADALGYPHLPETI